MLLKTTGISLATLNFKLQILCIYLRLCIYLCSSNNILLLIICIFESFFNIFFHKYSIRLHLDVILVLLLLMVTFFSFQNQLYFLCVHLKIHKTFWCNIFCNIKYVCFLCDPMPKSLILNIRKEQAHLFLVLKNILDCLHIHFLIKDSISA